jgi:signal peptidase I
MNLDFNSWAVKIAIVALLVAAREAIRWSARGKGDGAYKKNAKSLIETLDSATMAIALVLFIIQPFLLQAFYIPSSSMENTLLINDRLLVSKLIYRLRDPQFQEVVVFQPPPAALRGSALAGSTDIDYIKRCIGTPGDIVYVTGGKVFRKAPGDPMPRAINEPYIKPNPVGMRAPRIWYDMKIVDGAVYSRDIDGISMPGPWQTIDKPLDAVNQARINKAAPGPVPPGAFLMLGDNRNNSHDGHKWGFVPRANIVGKALCVFWPLNRINWVSHLSFPAAPYPLRLSQSAAP